MIQARSRFGQNFLIEKSIISRIIESLKISPDDNIIEIGPGKGALTEKLVESNCTLSLVEIDRDLVDILRKKYHGLSIVNEDILKVEFNALFGGEPKRIIGNLPYNISTQIMLNLIDSFERIEDIHFLVQKEVAQKVVGKQSTKSWGKLAIKMSSFFNTEILFDVPPEAFDIKPKVNSSFIRLIPKKDINYDLSIKNNLFKVIDLAFSSRRKNVKNNLKSLDINWENLELDPNSRSEDLSTQDFINLSRNHKI